MSWNISCLEVVALSLQTPMHMNVYGDAGISCGRSCEVVRATLWLAIVRERVPCHPNVAGVALRQTREYMNVHLPSHFLSFSAAVCAGCLGEGMGVHFLTPSVGHDTFRNV